MKHYDLIVIGSGPAGEKAAVKAAFFGKKVALIEKERVFGGAGVFTGTLPSKTLKETALYISGKYEKGIYGIERGLEHEATIEDFLRRKNLVSAIAGKGVRDNLTHHGVDLYHGVASFLDPHILRAGEEMLYGDYVIIATGSYPVHPKNIPFDGIKVHDSDTILNITSFPKTLCIVGAGVIGCEYATIFSTMGTKVYLVNATDEILSHVDVEVTSELISQMKEGGMEILFNTSLRSVQKKEKVEVELDNQKTLIVDMFLFAAGRSGNIKDLHLDQVGVQVGKRETVIVDAEYRTNIPHIFAVGDVIGFPALASTSMDQGRIAVAHIFHTEDLKRLSDVIAYGIYTIPEISMVGATEETEGLWVGKAFHKDMARGRIMGATSGFLKMVFEPKELRILGVHIIGHAAAELIHYGVLLIKDKKNLLDVIGEVFNYPTLHDLYKYAAYDGLTKMVRKNLLPK